MRRFTIAGLCLFWASAIVSGRLDGTAATFDYRGHHDEAAAKYTRSGSDQQSGSGINSERPREVPRLRDKSSQYNKPVVPDRWAQYVPSVANDAASDSSEDRRGTREPDIDSGKVQKQQKETSAKEKLKAKLSPIQKGVEKVKSATKKTTKRAQAKVKHLFDEDDDDDDDDDEDEDGNGRGAGRRKSKNGIWSRIWSALVWTLTKTWGGLGWSSRILIWTPATYLAGAIRWSAHTSWNATRWTGERAFIGPALTAGAPLIYLVQGLLFIFVFVPVRIASVVGRELYPIYVFLGAALAVGTAMGIAAALILYIGSFLLNDTSPVEKNLSRRAEMIPDELQQRFRRQRKTSPTKRRAKKGDSIIDRAMRESLERGKRAKQYDSVESPDAAESDEEDDYFGNSTMQSSVGRGQNAVVTPTGLDQQKPMHFGPPLPVGATNQGGWNTSRAESASSTPSTTPIALRGNLANSSQFAYSSARSIPNLSPMSSPDYIRASGRQRRSVNSSA